MATVIERVRAGATLLDATVPGWEGKIDPETLDLQSCVGCILGQCFDIYGSGTKHLGLNHQDAVAFGFHAEAEHSRDVAAREYAQLAPAWLHEIALRLNSPATEEARIEALPEDVGCVWGAL